MNHGHYKNMLLVRKAELESHNQQSEDTRAPVELDQTVQGRLSRQDALMQQAMAEATQRNRTVEIHKIEAALKRIESDDFGYCLSCNEEISEARLGNDPAVATCINCAK